MDKSVKETIQMLEASIKEDEMNIKEKHSALKVLYNIVGESTFNNNNAEVSKSDSLIKMEEHGNQSFPKNSRTDKQVMFLFDNFFTHAEKFAKVQSRFNELLGAEKNIYNVCRSLKKMGLLSVVQYNKQNKLSYWGKKSWVGDTDFIEEFKPDPDEMPIEITKIEILLEEDDSKVKMKKSEVPSNIGSNADDLPF